MSRLLKCFAECRYDECRYAESRGAIANVSRAKRFLPCLSMTATEPRRPRRVPDFRRRVPRSSTSPCRPSLKTDPGAT